MFPHAFAEEAVLWPALRRVISGGEQLTVEVEVSTRRPTISTMIRLPAGAASVGDYYNP
jgi:hypothetical protein